MDSNLSQSPREDGCECKAHPPDVQGRNLVVCIDGASNQSGDTIYELRSFANQTVLAVMSFKFLRTELRLMNPKPFLREPQLYVLTSLAEHGVFRTMVVTNHIGNKPVTWRESSDRNIPETATTLEALLGKYGQDGSPVIIEERSTSGVDTESGQRGRKRPTTIV
ncbi:hypothetical protein BU17DRAFT_65501 [Hysterangium stoloniferum]|nr:hypothetical protein BU17DRAFT_65501 [Hysterangium stoloniferum]